MESSMLLSSPLRKWLLPRLGVNKAVARFSFDESTTFLASNTFVVGTTMAYLALIFGLHAFMRKRAAFTLKPLVVVHNALLSLASLVLLVLLTENVIPKVLRYGLPGSICKNEVFDDGYFIFYCFVNYLLKYYELIDTVILVLKKKELSFLHVYHHTMTLLLTFIQLKERTAVQWVPIVANLLVHVVMYYYYTLSTLGIRSWWKPFLTGLQISQFIIDVVFCYWASYLLFFSTETYCAGTPLAALFGSGLLTTYLIMFIDFFVKTYSQKPPLPIKRRNKRD